MSELILNVTEISFDSLVLKSDHPVLLDMWAPWCVPCRAVAPVLERLAPEYEGSLQIAKLDVEMFPQMQRQLGVRGIPTLILFRDGKEVSRQIGVKSAEEFRHWLAEHAIKPTQAGALQREEEGAGDGAFYGDPQLRDFLVSRLRGRASRGEVSISFAPFWDNGNGTISRALVSHGSTDVFSRVSGLPASFAAVLELCCSEKPGAEDVDTLLGDVKAGADLRNVAAKMTLALMTDAWGLVDWTAVLAGSPVDELRQRWVHSCQDRMAGHKVDSSRWQALNRDLTQLAQQSWTPDQERERVIVNFLLAMTPLPRSDESDKWLSGFLSRFSSLRTLIAGILAGWSAEIFGLERVRDAWYQARETRQPGGKFTEQGLKDAHQAWHAEHGKAQEILDVFISSYNDNIRPVTLGARSLLKRCLAESCSVKAD